MSSFRKHNSYTVHLDLNGTNVVKLVEVAEGFAEHFQSVDHNFPVGYHSGISSSDFFQLLLISELDILKATKRLGPSKSIGLYGIFGFIIKSCSSSLNVFSIVPYHGNAFQRVEMKGHCAYFVKKATILPLLTIDRFLF